MNKIRIRFFAEYHCWPIWIHDTHISERNIDPTVLPISTELANALNTWSDTYDATLNQEYPPDSCFPSEGAKQEFLAEGERLYKELVRELGDDYIIEYRSIP